MAFQGWPPEAFGWFEGLEEDNSKAYFTGTRAVYESSVKGPLLALLAEVEGEFGGAHLFRPYRDVRFSADKARYKTQASAVVGGSREDGSVYYLEVSMDGLLAASDYHEMTRDQLVRYRAAVHEEVPGKELEQIVADLEEGGYRVSGEALKTAPRGYARDHPRVRLLRHKGVTVSADLPPGRTMSSRRALDHVVTTWRAAAPLNTWLAENVGPSEQDRWGQSR